MMDLISQTFGPTKIAYKDEIGRSTWLLLHALADHYPVNEGANEEYEAAMRSLIDALSVVYPCEDCRNHLRMYIETHPPRFENKAHTVRWLFNLHNDVNARLRKPEFSVKNYATRLFSKFSDVGVDGHCTKCSNL